ncbi:MAG: hypothetical protein JWN25_121 [Verrucomicrobiales bacterium]|nr:hypothetical protein [Verrucomicrobiales bacterium]MDB6129292.1 hypothetical protein [Verrucomicrobiales bacterium]
MESHELLREVLQSSNPKHAAAELGLSLSMIYKWTEPSEENKSGASNPLDRVAALYRVTQDPRIIQWLCQIAGGFFIKNPKGSWPHPTQLVPATNTIIQEFADLLSTVAFAAHDNQISNEEAASIRGKWEELKTVTESFVSCCEAGNFSGVHQVSQQRNSIKK